MSGMLSQLSEVNIDEETRELAGITSHATFFGYAYPDSDIDPAHVELRYFGAFVYLNNHWKVVQINLLHNLPAEGSKVLPLSEPFELPPRASDQLRHDRRRLDHVDQAPFTAPRGTTQVYPCHSPVAFVSGRATESCGL